MPLTDVELRNLKPGPRAYKRSDAGGLYVEVQPKGSKYWRWKYRFQGKEKRLSFGVYPEVGLKQARVLRDRAKETLRSGTDPSAERKASRAQEPPASETFEAVAREWFSRNQEAWVKKHGKIVLHRLQRDVFPWIGKLPISTIESPEVLQVLRRIESRGAHETAHRIRGTCSQVFQYAVASGKAKGDPCASLRKALTPTREVHRAFIREPKGIGELLRAIDGYAGTFATKCALRLAPLLLVRPGELRHAEWKEIDLEAAEWRIPPEKMKMRQPHLVPLSRQALEILRDLKPLTGEGRYVFPSVRTGSRPMSDNTVNAALRRLGYEKNEMTGHGFRAMASTLLNEKGFSPDAIERQLAHAPKNKVRAAYNHADYLAERKKILSAWADYLDTLRKTQ